MEHIWGKWWKATDRNRTAFTLLKFQYGTGNVHTWFDTTESDAAGASETSSTLGGRLVFVWARGRGQVAVGAMGAVGPVSVVFLRRRMNLVFIRAGLNVTAVILWHLGRVKMTVFTISGTRFDSLHLITLVFWRLTCLRSIIEISYAHQGCIYLIKNTVKTVF